MSVIDEEIEVDVPLRATYDQWTQFEEFPAFMQGVEEVRQLDDTRLHWVASIAGVRREWDARITEQIPDQMVAWTSTEGTRNDGLVTFEAEGAHRTRVTLRLDLEPEGALETVGEALGLVRARAKGDLQRFKAFIEERRLPSGAWRGEVAAGEVVADVGDSAPAMPSGRRAAGVGGPRSHRSASSRPARAARSTWTGCIGTIPGGPGVRRTAGLGLHLQRCSASLGEHLAEFGRERVQVLGVARVDVDEAMSGTDGIAGNLRVLADPGGELAQRYDVEYRTGRSGDRPGRGRRPPRGDLGRPADEEGLADALRLRLGQTRDWTTEPTRAVVVHRAGPWARRPTAGRAVRPMLPWELTVPVQVLFASPTSDGVVLDCTVAEEVVTGSSLRIPSGSPFSLLIDSRSTARTTARTDRARSARTAAPTRRWCSWSAGAPPV